MAFIGNTVQTQGFTPAIDYFSGNASTVTFTLSRPVVSVSQMIVSVANVIQNPSSAFTVSGSSITFTSAPPSGTNNIWVEYTSLITTYAAISQSPSVIGDITTSGGFFAQGTFGNTYIDGTIVDYVTGMGRITAGPADGITLYNGGTSARSALMALDSSGNMGVGTTSPATKLEVDFSNANTTIASAPVLTLKNTSFTNSNVTGIVAQNSVGGNVAGIDFVNINQVTDGSGASGSINFWQNTSGTKAYGMKINYGGYVTTPYQPAFCVGISGTITSSGVMVFNVTSGTGGAAIFFNRGSYYSTSNGRFTAPVAGAYQFNFMALLVGGSGAWVEVNTLLNGTISQQSRRETTGTDNNTVNISTIVYMNANDYFQITIAGFSSGAAFQANDTRIFNSFSGSLLG